jgi:beta-glucanase (GH16 family)
MINIEPPSSPYIPAVVGSRPLRSNLCARFSSAVCLFLLAACSFAHPAVPATPKWLLAWSDEFNGPNGSAPNSAKWKYDIGGGGFGNHELESYTSRPVNVQQRKGKLVISALKENYTGADGIARNYTSARIRTQGLFDQTYGRFEASIRLPLGKGIWPAFWMLGNNIGSVGWPACGEMDIFENIGQASTIYSTLHGPGYSGANSISAKYSLPGGKAVNTAFHLYAVEWAPNDIKFFFDNHLVAEQTPSSIPAGTTWVFNKPFFIILDVAVGGGWPGNPDQTTTFPQQMLVDFVRVYTAGTEASLPKPSSPLGNPGKSTNE